MNHRMKYFAATTAVLLAAWLTTFSDAQVKTIPTESDPPQNAAVASAATMRAKLSYSQKVLEGLVTQDFAAIEQAAQGLSKISLTPPPRLGKAGDQSDAEVYEHFRMEFARLSGQLEGHARRNELEASAWVMQNLTASCISCHDYIRDWPER